MRLRHLLAGLLASLGVIGVARADLFVVVTSAEPQVQAMAMLLAQQAQQRQNPVRVLLCAQGGEMALKGQAGPVLQPFGRTPQQMLQAVLDGGATVDVCPLFMANAPGRTPGDLIPGVGVTSPAAIGEYMARPEVRYFTF